MGSEGDLNGTRGGGVDGGGGGGGGGGCGVVVGGARMLRGCGRLVWVCAFGSRLASDANWTAQLSARSHAAIFSINAAQWGGVGVGWGVFLVWCCCRLGGLVWLLFGLRNAVCSSGGGFTRSSVLTRSYGAHLSCGYTRRRGTCCDQRGGLEMGRLGKRQS